MAAGRSIHLWNARHMNTHRFAAAILATVFIAPATFAADAKPREKQAIEAATRLQVFLDRAEFAPGKIDGRYGEFTIQALALYRQSRGEQAPAPAGDKPKQKVTPDVNGLDLASVEPVFIEYTVTEDDLKSVGELADSIPEQAKQKSLPYKTAAEAIAEKYHTDIDFLAELNPGKTKTIKAGDVLTVPNAQPFELAEVKDLKAGSEVAANDAESDDTPDKPDRKASAKNEAAEKSEASAVAVQVDVKTNMLTVLQGEKLIAAYPVTVGSERTESPVGEWKVRGVAKMPTFRYDKAMLNKGERSSDFHLLPPGPNNLVGIIWIQLNKKGIGLHGTSEPDAIGRNASHGCVRLANWDVVRLAAKIKAGVPVSIR